MTEIEGKLPTADYRTELLCDLALLNSKVETASENQNAVDGFFIFNRLLEEHDTLQDELASLPPPGR